MSYVHGYSTRETQRLNEQSVILEELLHDEAPYKKGSIVLEAGCGVGAQTRILCRRNPGIQLISMDISSESLDKARENVSATSEVDVKFVQEDVLDMSFENESFSHIFVCFLLEHLSNPELALSELYRVLKPGGSISVIEGDHGSCFWYPETANSLRVWNSLIEIQKKRGHDPIIGRRLFSLLEKAGFEKTTVRPKWVYADKNDPFLLDNVVNKIIVPMVNSSMDEVISTSQLNKKLWLEGIHDLSVPGQHPEGSFFYTWFKGTAIKPNAQ